MSDADVGFYALIAVIFLVALAISFAIAGLTKRDDDQ